MPNMSNKIMSHNKGVLLEHENKIALELNGPVRTCNCTLFACPVNQKCLTPSTTYQSVVIRADDSSAESYVGNTGGTFKARWRNHDSNFNNSHSKGTRLSTHVKKLKFQNVDFQVKWKLLQQAPIYSPSTKICQLCTEEKWLIIFKPEMATLNKRTELTAPCLHKQKILL